MAQAVVEVHHWQDNLPRVMSLLNQQGFSVVVEDGPASCSLVYGKRPTLD